MTGEGLEHRGRQPASVAQEVALPTQGAELHGEAELVDHAAANGDLLQVRLGQREVFAQAFRIEGFWQPLLSRTILLDSGLVPIDQVQKFLGHFQLSTTQIYAETSTRAPGENDVRALAAANRS